MQHMYIDECKGSNQSFYLLTHIYGDEKDFKSFCEDIAAINRANPTLTGTHFTGIHAKDINDGNISSKGRLVELWLDKFEEYVLANRIKCFITIQSREKKRKNSDLVAPKVISFIENEKARKMCPPLAEVDDQGKRDIAACVHQIWFLGCRSDKIDVDELIVFPDQIGKIIEDIDEHAAETYDIPLRGAVTYKGVINIVLNSVLHSIRVCFEQKHKISINGFEPQQDQSSIPIQICDILGNYIFHSIRAKKMNPKSISTYKLGVLESRFNLKQCLDDYSKNFYLNDKQELECGNDKDVMCVEIKSVEIA